MHERSRRLDYTSLARQHLDLRIQFCSVPMREGNFFFTATSMILAYVLWGTRVPLVLEHNAQFGFKQVLVCLGCGLQKKGLPAELFRMNPDAAELSLDYVHRSVNSAHNEKMCFVRFLALSEMMRTQNMSRFVHMDLDIVLTPSFVRLTWPRVNIVTTLESHTSTYFAAFDRRGVETFAQFIRDTYSNRTRREHFWAAESIYRYNRKVPHVSDMYLLRHFLSSRDGHSVSHKVLRAPWLNVSNQYHGLSCEVYLKAPAVHFQGTSKHSIPAYIRRCGNQTRKDTRQ